MTYDIVNNFNGDCIHGGVQIETLHNIQRHMNEDADFAQEIIRVIVDSHYARLADIRRKIKNLAAQLKSQGVDVENLLRNMK